MNEEEEKEFILQNRAKYFFDNHVCVHISFKNDIWKNGFIKEISSDFIILNELLEGAQPIFFLEMKSIEAFKDRSGKNDKKV